MTTNTPRPLLTREQQANAVSRIQTMARANASIVRCDGTFAEHRTYLEGSKDLGWKLAGRPVRGDLLLSVIGSGRSRVIVSVCRVEKMERGSAVWANETDVTISPPVPWLSVMGASGLPRSGQAWSVLTESKRSAFLDALIQVLRSNADVANKEGKRQLTSCRRRSRANRQLKLDEAGGVCAGCNVNLRAGFGARGDRGLEVHHLTPLSTQDEGEVMTSLSDLIVLCATCHRLLHADPELNLDTLRAGWISAR